MSNEIKLPDLGEGVIEGEILKILVSPGETISPDQPLMEVMTDKASMEIPSSKDGIIKEIKAKVGDRVEVGQTVFVLEASAQASGTKKQQNPSTFESKKQQSPPTSETKKQQKENTVSSSIDSKKADSASDGLKKDIPRAAPPTRKLAEELGIPLERVKGTGQQGQITREDLLQHIKGTVDSKKTSTIQTKKPMEVAFEEEDRREPVRGVKRIMFETMSYSNQNLPHFTILEQAKVTDLVRLREEFKIRLAKQNLKITYLPFIMKAVLLCLKDFPLFNSLYDEEKAEIVYKKSAHLGFAVDTSQGLLVPVIHEAQNKSLLNLTKEIQTLAEEARKGEIARGNLKGGTFTLTNLGSIGGIAGTPIINPPQVSILGIYRLYKQLQKKEGNVEEVPYINFSLTCDHRLIDGATAARFLKSLILRIEDPGLLILES